MAGRRQQGEGSVYHRRDPDRDQWVAVVDLGWRNGKRDRREFTGATPEEAINRRREWSDRRAQTGFTPPKGRPPYVSEWLRHWLYNIARPRVQRTTWEKSYRQKVEELMIPFFAKTRLDQLDDDDIRAWHAHLLRTPSPHTGRPVSASTIKTAHRILSAALNDALRAKPRRLGWNPAAGTPPPPAVREEPMPPDEDEVHAILTVLEGRRTGARWASAMGTGLRQGESLGMLWPHVDIADPDDASIDVQWELVRLSWAHGCEDPHACGARLHRLSCPDRCPLAGKGRHRCRREDDAGTCPPGCTAHASSCPQRSGGGLRLTRPKSEHSRARVPLPRFAALMLRQWRTEQKEERLALGPEWEGWAHSCGKRIKPRQYVCTDCQAPAKPDLLVVTQPNGHPVNPRADWGDWGALLEEAGVERYGLHTGTRHGTATALLEEGVDIRVVQEIMRHASPDFTRKAYQHVRQKLRTEAASALNRRMGR